MAEKPVATIGILTWRSKDLLKGLLESIARYRWEYPYEIVVVDNDSGDDTMAMIEKEWPSVRLVKNPENRGVAPARNQIFRMSECEFVIILDVDTVVHPGSLDALVRHHEGAPRGGHRRPQARLRRRPAAALLPPLPFPLEHRHRGYVPPRLVPRSRFVRDYTMEDWDHEQLREVDWMYGAAWIIRKTALDRVGLFDEGFFYLYEDIDLCFRMKKQGMKILYDPRAVVTHYLPRERKGIFHERIRIRLRSILRYLLKDYFGLPLGTKTSPAPRSSTRSSSAPPAASRRRAPWPPASCPCGGCSGSSWAATGDARGRRPAPRHDMVASFGGGGVSVPAGAVVVTGASSGIGLDACRELAAHRFRVFGTVRREGDEAAVRAVGATPLRLDVTSRDSIRAAADEVRGSRAPRPWPAWSTTPAYRARVPSSCSTWTSSEPCSR